MLALYANININIYIYAYICEYGSAYIYTDNDIRIVAYMQIYVCTYIYIYIYIYTSIHRYAHMRLKMYILPNSLTYIHIYTGSALPLSCERVHGLLRLNNS